MASLGLIYFYFLAATSVGGALLTVAARNPIRSAMGLLLTIVSISGLFLALHAEFLAIIQLILYAGAIVVLFIFVIMLLGPDAAAPRDKRGQIVRAGAGAIFGLAAAGAMVLAWRGWNGTPLRKTEADFGDIGAFGRTLFADALVPFELSSALLMVAVVGAVAVARGRQGEDKEKGKAA